MTEGTGWAAPENTELRAQLPDEDGIGSLSPATGLELRSEGPAGLPFLPGESARLWGHLIPHSRDLKAMMSAPSSAKRPLPTILYSRSGWGSSRDMDSSSSSNARSSPREGRSLLGEQSGPSFRPK